MMDEDKWERVSSLDLEEMEDGSEIIWEKKIDIWEKIKVPCGDGKTKKQSRLTGFRYESFRTILSKRHHLTVSGYLPCLVSSPNAEFPYFVPWQSDWTYAGNGSHYQMWRRKEGPDENQI